MELALKDKNVFHFVIFSELLAVVRLYSEITYQKHEKDI